MKFDASCFNRSRNFLSAVARLFKLSNFSHSVVIKAWDVRWQRRVPAVSRIAAATVPARTHSITQNPSQLSFVCISKFLKMCSKLFFAYKLSGKRMWADVPGKATRTEMMVANRNFCGIHGLFHETKPIFVRS